MNTPYLLAKALIKISENDPKTGLPNVFNDLFEDMDADEAKMYIIRLFEEAVCTVTHLKLSPSRLDSMVMNLRRIQAKFLKFCSANTVNEFNSGMSIVVNTELLNSFGDTVDTSDAISKEMLDKPALIESTEQLTAFVHEADLPEMAKEVLLINLSAFSRIIKDVAFTPTTP